MTETKHVNVFSKEDFRNWLAKNHDKENKVFLVLHKKHTGKPSPSHKELMEEAICFGWIDTTIKRVDQDKFIRTFQRRNEKSKWSQNTLKYGRQLIKEKRMTPHGLKFYHEGRKKKAFDHGIPKNPLPPEDLLKELSKSKKAEQHFTILQPSLRKTYSRWTLMAKTEEARRKRIVGIRKRMLSKDWRILKF